MAFTLRAALVVVLCLAPIAVKGQLAPPYQVADINTSFLEPLKDHAHLPLASGDDVFFQAWSALWRTDGTEAGTYFVGPATDLPRFVFGNRVLYNVRPDPAVWVHETWITDGTHPGTFKISDGQVQTAAACGDALCFSTGNAAVKITDGTIDGTRVLAYTEPDVPTNLPLSFATAGKQLYFNGYDSAHGRCYPVACGTFCGELWTSDGTTAGTRLAVDLNPGPFPSAPRQLFSNGVKLYFNAVTVENGAAVRCPFVTDGTPAGTKQLATGIARCTSVCDATEPEFFAVRGHTYLRVNSRLYLTDGTPEGTRGLGDILGIDESSFVFGLAAATDRLVFTVNRRNVVEVWSSDFAFGSKAHLFDTQSYADVLGTSRTGAVLVQGNAGIHGPRELWITDGTVAGSHRLRVASSYIDAYKGLVSSSRYDFFTTGQDRHGLLRTDGTPEGTTQVAHSIARGAGSYPSELVSVADQLFFLASDATAVRGLYRARADTASVTRLTDCSKCWDLTAGDGRLYFTKDGVGWTSDGSVAGTMPLSEWANTTILPYMRPVKLGEQFVFVGHDGTAGYGLYATFGKTSRRLVALPNESGGVQGHTVIDGDRLVFQWGIQGLWCSDGTADGTKRIATVGVFNDRILAAGSRAFFVGFTPDTSYALWVTDGTSEGTKRLTEKMPALLVTRAGILYFVDGDTGSLRRTDGTSAGTFDLQCPPNWTPARSFDAGPHVAFLVRGESGSVELWTTDGTSQGVVFRRELPMREIDESTTPFIAPDEQAYVISRSANSVRLSNLSGGSDRETTFPAIAPIVNMTAQSFGKIAVVATSEALFFSAGSMRYGPELWAMRLDGSSQYHLPAVRVEDATLMTLAGDRRVAVFKVEMSGIETNPVTVRFATSDGSAIAGRDYVPSSGTLTLSSTTPPQSVAIPVSANGTGMFWLTLSDAKGAHINRGLASAMTAAPSRRRAARH